MPRDKHTTNPPQEHPTNGARPDRDRLSAADALLIAALRQTTDRATAAAYLRDPAIQLAVVRLHGVDAAAGSALLDYLSGLGLDRTQLAARVSRVLAGEINEQLYYSLLTEANPAIWLEERRLRFLDELEATDPPRFDVLLIAAERLARLREPVLRKHLERLRTQRDAPAIVWQRASDLQYKPLAPLRWCIPGLIPEGLLTLAGRPKKGKSMLALNLALAKAEGGLALGQFDAGEPGDVAYLALEDGERRVKYRIEQLMPPDAPWPARLWLTYRAPRMSEGLLEALSGWADEAEHPALVIVDILARIQPPSRQPGNAYDAEYAYMAALMDWASARQLTVLVITHSTKAKAEDVFEQVIGTTANTGATATNMVLVRRGDDKTATLHAQGKDVAPQELALHSLDGFHWEYVGDAQDLTMSAERRLMLEALYDSAGQACTRQQLLSMLGITANALNQRIIAAREAGYVLLRDGKVELTTKAALLIAEARAQDREPEVS